MSIMGNLVGSYSQLGKTVIIIDENNNEFTGVIVDKEQIFDALPSDVKAGKVFANDDGVQVGTAVIGSDGCNVTFGYVDGVPAERETSYVITSEQLNELGAIAQQMSGKTKLLTINEMITILNRVEYIPQGNAESIMQTDVFETSGVATLPNVQRSDAVSTMRQVNLIASVIGALQEE